MQLCSKFMVTEGRSHNDPEIQGWKEAWHKIKGPIASSLIFLQNFPCQKKVSFDFVYPFKYFQFTGWCISRLLSSKLNGGSKNLEAAENTENRTKIIAAFVEFMARSWIGRSSGKDLQCFRQSLHYFLNIISMFLQRIINESRKHQWNIDGS